MENKLKFLTVEDYNLLLEKAESATYAKDTVIIQEGCVCESIYILRKGIVRVESAASGKGVAIAFLQPGDIFGEISLLEDMAHSAKIVAEETVEVLILQKTIIYSLLVSVPGLSARFYQSLAYNLSSRLRETSSLLSYVMGQMIYEPEFVFSRTGFIGQKQIPPELISEIELFKKNLLGIEQDLRDKKISEETVQETVSRACNMLINSLREQIIHEPKMEQAIGTYVFRETFPFFMLSSFIDSAFRKPRECANDSYIVELLSQNEPEGDGYLGVYIDRWIRSIPTCLALKNRGNIITATLNELADNWTSPNPMPVTSLASGAANEILDLYFQTTPPNIKVTCIDLNHRYLARAANLARKIGCNDCLTFVQENVLLLAQNNNRMTIPPQQIIYSVSMSNYLRDRELISLLNWIYEHLLPNGTVILGNFHAANPDRVLLEQILEWHLIYRSAEELERIFARSKFRSLPVEIESDEFGVELFVVCNKSW